MKLVAKDCADIQVGDKLVVAVKDVEFNGHYMFVKTDPGQVSIMFSDDDPEMVWIVVDDEEDLL